MARDKFYEARMQGIIYAYNMAKDKGIEALEKDIKMRNITKLPISMNADHVVGLLGELSANLYHNMLCAVGYLMHSEYGFGKKRLQEFKENFDKAVEATLDFDYMGEHYVRLEDYAVEMKEKFPCFNIDIERVAFCQDQSDKDDPRYRMCKVDRVLEELRRVGYNEAADFLERKMDR